MPLHDAFHRVADRLMPTERRLFLKAVTTLQEALDLEELANVLTTHGEEALLRSIPWETLDASLRPMIPVLVKGFRAAGAIAADQTGDLLNVSVTFNAANPRAVAWAERVGGRLISGINQTTREGLRAIIAGGIEAGTNPRETARAIRARIGLTSRQARAVATYYEELEAEGGRDLAGKVERYAAKLLRQRAEMIARTETMAAVNEGQLELWRQARADGLLPAAVERTWVTTPDDRLCPICEPMEGQTVALEEVFVSPEDGSEAMAPPIHPSCRCAEVLAL